MNDFTLHEALQLAVTTEQIGAKLYNRFAEKLADQKDIADIFSRLAKDELSHEKQFAKLLEQHPKGETDAGKYGVDEYLKATAISEFFRKDAFNNLAEIHSAKDALITAARLERATLLFYHALKDSIGPEKALDELIRAEKEHLTTLTKIAISDARFRGLQDTW